MDEVLKDGVFDVCRTCPAPETHKSDDHVDGAHGSPVISFQLPMRRATEVGGRLLYPRWDDDVGYVLPDLIEDVERKDFTGLISSVLTSGGVIGVHRLGMGWGHLYNGRNTIGGDTIDL